MLTLMEKDGKKRFALLDFFLPMSEMESQKQLKKLGTTTLTRTSVTDFMMFMQRGADKFVQHV